MKSRYLIASLVLVTATATLAACGGDDASTSGSPAAASSNSAAGSATDFNDADTEFAQGMIPHHEQAIEMADMALDPTMGAGDEVKDLATRIKQGQDPEITMMSGWLTSWGQSMTMDSSGGHDMSSMDGMMSSDEMDKLGAMSGAPFDKMWMEMMIRHHEGAIEMAKTAKAKGSNPDVKAMADRVIAAQQAEIDEMKALMAG